MKSCLPISAKERIGFPNAREKRSMLKKDKLRSRVKAKIKQTKKKQK